jgi:hypothetical protein
MSPQLPNPSSDFQSQLSSFENYASDFHLSDLISPVSQQPATPVSPVSNQQSATVQNASLAGTVAGAAANAVAGGAFTWLFNSRTIAFVLGILLIGMALFMFAFQGTEKGVSIILGGKKRAAALKEGIAAVAA